VRTENLSMEDILCFVGEETCLRRLIHASRLRAKPIKKTGLCMRDSSLRLISKPNQHTFQGKNLLMRLHARVRMRKLRAIIIDAVVISEGRVVEENP
jgi:hypothetical protein